MRCLFSFAFSAVLLGAVSQLCGGELKSPEGFTITYPDGWKPGTKAQVDQYRKTLAGMGFTAMILSPPSRDNFSDHVFVFIKPLPPGFSTLDAENKMKAIEYMADAQPAVPKNAKNVKTQQQEVSGTMAVAVSYETNPPARMGSTVTMRTWQVYVPGKEQVYVFHCATVKPHWDTAWPIFKKMVDSVHIDVAYAPQSKP